MNNLTVTELNKYIKNKFSNDFILNNVVVTGEISNFKESHNNYYFSLKDENSAISCIIFSNSYFGEAIDVIDGFEVTVYGRVAVYEKTGTYAIYVNKIENSGLGKQFVKLNELKNKLSEIGLFDPMYKKEIPKYSNKIGVVTAKNGAAIKDITKTIYNKNPYATVYLYPAKVQGDDASSTIVKGIEELNKLDIDVIIIGRGGGSIEDLFCFNEENVAYAIFNSKIPIISAVGHEINDSIADLVADLRVATPTAAGEACTFNVYDYFQKLENYKNDFNRITIDKIENIKQKIEDYNLKLSFIEPDFKLAEHKKNLLNKKQIFKNVLNNKLIIYKNKIKLYYEKFNNINPTSKLNNGLIYALDKNNKILYSVKNIKENDVISLLFKDGRVKSKVIKKEKI